MEVTRVSQLSGIKRTLNLPITQEQLDRYHKGALLQDAFPNLPPGEREFIKTGITDQEWQVIFPGEE